MRVIYYLLRISRTPGNLQLVHKLRMVLRSRGVLALTLERVSSFPENKRLIDSRVKFDLAKIVDRAYLRSLPKGSLGFEYAAFMDHYQISEYSILPWKIENEEDFVMQRLLLTHDVWHVVLGYPADELGEIGLTAFLYAQVRWPHSPFLMGGFLIRQMFRDPRGVPAALDAISEGWKKGKEIGPLFAVQWEERLGEPLEVIRRELGIGAAGKSAR